MPTARFVPKVWRQPVTKIKKSANGAKRLEVRSRTEHRARQKVDRGVCPVEWSTAGARFFASLAMPRVGMCLLIRAPREHDTLDGNIRFLGFERSLDNFQSIRRRSARNLIDLLLESAFQVTQLGLQRADIFRRLTDVAALRSGA